MSKLEVDKVTPQSGTTLTIGEAGDTTVINGLGTLPATIGSATQVLAVNAGATGLEYGTAATDLSNLNATNLTSGTIPDGRFPSILPAAGGQNLTSLQPAAIVGGTFGAINAQNLTNIPGEISWQSTIITTNSTIAASRGYWIDTTSNVITITLPASASVGDRIILTDYLRTWGTNALTINQNSLKFQGNTSPNPVYDTNGQSVDLVYSGATQGWIPNSDDNVTFETAQTYSIDFLVVGGGGGTGNLNTASFDLSPGGGGAGGFRTSTQSINFGNTITVTVGDGGAGGTNNSGNSRGASGSNSSISGTGLTTITSAGGGGSGASQSGSDQGIIGGGDGGSGGGGGCSQGTVGNGGTGDTPSTSPSQGNDGGQGGNNTGIGGSGGGGGANAAGADASVDVGGAGGAGTASSITGSSVTYAGGGGGGNRASGAGSSPNGGVGGGGSGGYNGSLSGQDGTANTGGGGGGLAGFGGNGTQTSGAGGKGVVILSMPLANFSGTTTGSPTEATSGSNKILTFTGSGSYTS